MPSHKNRNSGLFLLLLKESHNKTYDCLITLMVLKINLGPSNIDSMNLAGAIPDRQRLFLTFSGSLGLYEAFYTRVKRAFIGLEQSFGSVSTSESVAALRSTN